MIPPHRFVISFAPLEELFRDFSKGQKSFGNFSD